jgi:hypothetical protein
MVFFQFFEIIFFNLFYIFDFFLNFASFFGPRFDKMLLTNLFGRQDQSVSVIFTVVAFLGLDPPIRLWHFKVAQDSGVDYFVVLEVVIRLLFLGIVCFVKGLVSSKR